MVNKYIEVLQSIQSVLETIGFETTMHFKSDAVPVDMFSVKLSEGSNQVFTVNLLPLSEDLDGSYFIQFYYEFPFEVAVPSPDGLKNTLINVNRQLPIGHFNLTASGSIIYFKYVLAYPIDSSFNTGHLTDLTDMCTFAMTHFEPNFKAFDKKN